MRNPIPGRGASALLAALLALSWALPAAAQIPGCDNLYITADYFDLDTGTVCEFCDPPPPEVDFSIGYNDATPSNPIRLSQVWGRQVAFLDGVPFDDVGFADIWTATFGTDVVDVPFDHDDTMLLFTDQGRYFKVGLMSLVGGSSVDFCWEELAAPPGCENLGYEVDYLDLDTGTVCDDCDPPPAAFDFRFAYNGNTPTHVRLFQTSGRQVAFLDGRPYAEVDSTALWSADFGTDLVDLPLDYDDTVLLVTDQGAYYKVGLAWEVGGGSVDFCFEELTYYPGCNNLYITADYFDLDTGTVCEFCDPPPPEVDFSIGYNDATPSNPIRLSQVWGREVAFLDGAPYGDVDSTTIWTVTFGTDMVDVPFDHDDTMLMLTDQGRYYKIGLVDLVDGNSVQFCFEQLQPRDEIGPVIQTIADVPHDQGRSVRIRFLASVYDIPGSTTPIFQYEAFRRIDALPPDLVQPPMAPKELPPRRSSNATSPDKAPWDWEYVGAVPAHGDPAYSMIVPTLADSTVADGQHWSAFFLRAATAVPTVYFDSAPDSGYSLDNLAPSAPTNLRLAGADLTWSGCPEADFDYFTVYGSSEPTPGPAAEVLGRTAGTSLDIGESMHAYLLVTATDFAGNEGEAGFVSRATAVADPPAAFRLLGAAPNPLNPTTTIVFELPAAATVDLAIYDAAGRRVRELVAGVRLGPGRHGLAWDGRDDAGRTAPAGVYVYRLRAGPERAGGRMVLVK